MPSRSNVNSNEKNKDVNIIENRALPDLEYCEANVLHIYNQFRDMITRGKDKDKSLSRARLIEDGEYEFLNHKKKQLTPKAVLTEHGGEWTSIKKDTFKFLIELLHDKNYLDLYDNHLLYGDKSILAHCLNYFYKNSDDKIDNYSLKKLEGIYRTFTTATTDTQYVLKGFLKLNYIENGNFLETEHKQIFSPNDENTLYLYKGVINFFHSNHYLVWNDFWDMQTDDRSLRQTRLKIVPQENNCIRMDTVAFLNFGDGLVMRKMIIDNKLSSFPCPEKECHTMKWDSDENPYKKELSPNTHIKFMLSEFTR